MHSSAGEFWADGDSARLALERIPERGDPGEAVASLGAVAIDAAPANGASTTFEFVATPGDLSSSAQMLIATNDGFVGADSVALFSGDVGRTFTLNLMAYDAGTEENTGLFQGFAGGQPDPDQGAANVDNGTATAEVIAPLDLVSGAQATLRIEPATLPLAPPAAGTADSACRVTASPAGSCSPSWRSAARPWARRPGRGAAPSGATAGPAPDSGGAGPREPAPPRAPARTAGGTRSPPVSDSPGGRSTKPARMYARVCAVAMLPRDWRPPVAAVGRGEGDHAGLGDGRHALQRSGARA